MTKLATEYYNSVYTELENIDGFECCPEPDENEKLSLLADIIETLAFSSIRPILIASLVTSLIPNGRRFAKREVRQLSRELLREINLLNSLSL